VIARAIKGREGIWMANRSLTTKIHSALLVAVGWLQHTRCPRFRRGTFGYGTTTSPIQRGKAEVRSFHANARWYTQTSQMHMLCSACSKATFILVQKVVSKTKKNKLRNEDSIGSLIGTRFSDRGTWLITTSINNAYEHYCWRRCLIQALHRWGFLELPNNIWNYNSD
jgi:hypothetical protein